MDQPKISEKPEIKLHFLDYWRVIRMRKSLILTVFLLVVLTTTAMTFWLLPEKFASFARIEVNKDEPEIGVGMENRMYSGSYDPYFLQTQFKIIESSSILNGVITNLNLDQIFSKQGDRTLTVDETYEVLLRRIKVDQTRSCSLIEIWVFDSSPVLASQIANKIAEVYKDSRLEAWTSSRNAGIKALQENLDQEEDRLRAASSNLDDLKIKLKIPILEDTASFTETIYSERMRDLERYKNEASDSYEHDKALLDTIEALKPEKLRSALPTILPGDTELSVLAERLAIAEQEFLVASNGLGVQNPEYAQKKKALDLAQKQLQDKVDGVVIGTRSRVILDEARLTAATKNWTEANKESNASAKDYRPYIDTKREVENKKQMVELLTKQIVTAKMETHQPLSRAVRVLDMAKPAQFPVSPNKPLNIALGIIVGLIVGIGLAFFIEYLDTSVKTIDDVERALEAPVLAVIPQQVGILLEEGLDSPHAEAYRVLRTNLLFARKDESWNTITVLSGGAGEGKSTTLFNLATVFAQSGSRVLVVDSDLNRPSIHKMLHISNGVGLTDHLLKQLKLEEIIQTTTQANLDFLPSGKLPRASMGILGSNQMKEAIKELKRRYDFVFFDSPPLLGVSDASVLASQMDMTLQVIQYRRYPQLMTIRAKQMILKVGGHLMGIVLNNINMSQDENYYYYSGYYEYKSKQKDSPEVKETKPGEKPAKKADVEIKQKY